MEAYTTIKQQIGRGRRRGCIVGQAAVPPKEIWPSFEQSSLTFPLDCWMAMIYSI